MKTFFLILFFSAPYLTAQKISENDILIRPVLRDGGTYYPIASDSLWDKSEVHAVTSPTDPNIVAAFYHDYDALGYRPGYAISFDKGMTWQKGVISGKHGFDPVGGMTAHEVFYCYDELDRSAPPQAKTRVTVSVAPLAAFRNGNSIEWEHHRLDSLPSDKPWMAIDNSLNPNTRGNCYVAWIRTIQRQYEVMLAVGKKFGTDGYQFENSIKIDSGSGEFFHQGISMSVGIDGMLAITYLKIHTDSGFADLLFRYSEDAGESFSEPVKYGTVNWSRRYVTRGIDIAPLPSLAVDGERTAKIVLAVPTLDRWDIIMYTVDVYNEKSPEREVVASENGALCFFPSVAVFGGNVLVQYTRTNTTQDSVSQYIFTGYAHHALLEKPQDIARSGVWTWSHHYNQIAIACDGSAVYATFTDYRIPRKNGIFGEELGRFIGISLIPSSQGYALFQNYPNPFNTSTRIAYRAPQRGYVTLRVYDVLGREVATLVNEILDAGNHEARFDATGLASGVYFYRLTAGSAVMTKKMILLK